MSNMERGDLGEFLKRQGGLTDNDAKAAADQVNDVQRRLPTDRVSSRVDALLFSAGITIGEVIGASRVRGRHRIRDLTLRPFSTLRAAAVAGAILEDPDSTLLDELAQEDIDSLNTFYQKSPLSKYRARQSRGARSGGVDQGGHVEIAQAANHRIARMGPFGRLFFRRDSTGDGFVTGNDVVNNIMRFDNFMDRMRILGRVAPTVFLLGLVSWGSCSYQSGRDSDLVPPDNPTTLSLDEYTGQLTQARLPLDTPLSFDAGQAYVSVGETDENGDPVIGNFEQPAIAAGLSLPRHTSDLPIEGIGSQPPSGGEWAIATLNGKTVAIPLPPLPENLKVVPTGTVEECGDGSEVVAYPGRNARVGAVAYVSDKVANQVAKTGEIPGGYKNSC